MMNNKIMWQMMIAVTKKMRVARVMMTAMRLAGNKEGKGNKVDNCIGKEGGVQQRGR